MAKEDSLQNDEESKSIKSSDKDSEESNDLVFPSPISDFKIKSVSQAFKRQSYFKHAKEKESEDILRQILPSSTNPI